MPIKRLKADATARFPRIGKLRKGSEQRVNPKTGKALVGEDLDHFRFTSDDPELVSLFEARYGAEPQEVPVYIAFMAIDDAFRTWREEWVGGGLVHRCDGETCILWRKEDGTYSREKKPCPYKDDAEPRCKEVGRLSVMVPALFEEGHVGEVVFETHSINDILSIYGTLRATVEARGTENLMGIGFVLRRVEREISTPAPGGKRVRRKKWLVELQPAAEWFKAQLETHRSVALALPPPAPSGYDIDEETGEILEFRPGDDLARQAARERMGGVGLGFDGAPVDAVIEGEAEEQEPEDVIEGEVEEQEPEDAKDDQEADTSDQRPYPIDVVCQKVRDIAKQIQDGDKPVEEGTRGSVCGVLEALFEGSTKEIKTANRHGLLRFFWDVDSSYKLTQGQAVAMRVWAAERIKENGKTSYAPLKEAAQEAMAIINLRTHLEGQGEISF